MAAHAVDELISTIAPEDLCQVILRIAEQQEAGTQGVAAASVMSHFMEGRDWGTGVERSRAYFRLRQAIQDQVAKIEGMKYISSSA